MYRHEQPSQRRPFLITAFQNKLFAVDRMTGAIRWRLELGGGNAYKGNRTIVELAIDSDVVIALTATYIGFISYTSGELLRELHLEPGSKMTSSPTLLIEGGQLFVTGSGSVVCYSMSGDRLWEQAFDGEGYGDTAVGFPGVVRQANDRIG